ncbi:MAG: type II secretion system F family protein [Marinosulfonomonas sp.]|nr:type II secretion system F family protein [Marinosulfonomonas sp.]
MGFLESINTTLTGNFGEFGPLLAVGILGMFLMLLTIPILMNKKEDPLDRMRKTNAARNAAMGAETKLRQSQGTDKLDKYANFLEPQDEEEYSAIRLKLLQAGYPSKTAVRTYHFMQFILGIGMLAAGTAYALTLGATDDQTTKSMMLSILVPGIIGYLAPKYWVTKRRQKREEEIINGFPDALDLMLVCVEAGQSLDQSIIRVATEIRSGFPDLADEFSIVSQEMKAGKDRISVLRDMSERVGVPDVASFVTVLIQSASFGTSVADALRVFSAEMRDKRVMRAEEKANKLPTKMTLATMMLTLPPLLIILIGPSVYGMSTMLAGANF